MRSEYQTSSDAFVKRRFDYIVIGGGTAGLAVASRLAERTHLQVGVLEAGRSVEGDDNVQVPAFYGRSLQGENDWCHRTAPQDGLAGRTLPWPRGKTLGGTSALNFMTWVRASRQDYDAWEELGNPGWGWDSLLEYSASHSLWHRTLNAVGIPTNVAHTAGSNVGVWTNINSVDPRTAKRSYATSYLDSEPKRPNLHVLTGAHVKRVVLDADGTRIAARGVLFECGGQEFEVSARQEIIVSAGTVQSPQILESSGIGNPDVLDQVGVPVRVKSPMVGENLQEHIMLATIFEVDPTLANPDDLSDDVYAARAREEYNAARRGPLTVLPCSICYVPLKDILPQPVLADIKARAQLHSAYGAEKTAIVIDRLGNDTELGHMEYIFDLGNWSPYFKGEAGKKYGTMLQILQYPFSVGSIHLRPYRASSEGAKELHIDPGYYHGKHGQLDAEIMQKGTRFLRKIVETEPLANIIHRPVAPTTEDFQDDGRMCNWIAENTITDWHPVGTCAMGGDAGVEGGVVNERLQVYGVENLRVIDASVMPLQISAHLQATVYAIAEKGAAMILEDLDKAQ
ncbi:Glucose-methanol-choline oxidoreductase [Cordyceps fumosorosea ARSEF 2679]|uniref:Glucose-methanol-choline oxidoreductase n=1 Tax=Cordyceps fumosorosea (strain ARSEF 2679) TaxID=1081104 RepID=A0A162I6G7_CORFA|nr:Glucose-methanol-choline oxidoreductase [Cordyceps fumosorosea ARSEF 2679]OAA52935.1 Glucose-methanol-choline oxidoreductase [Cordyceps fumosorosea ARSEF 2679]